ncbi:hypothetical protein CAEBREN_17130 [Caenorhabditis brenneri]|uniref:Uncharacterized protein n=1 Tax=Caenorhabditis brenneri TaxID=135651 RepID=G0MWX9_CAEBE|nr:hypothetical protein CAEBREN_17130 [Caenorhabditis brenneri]
MNNSSDPYWNQVLLGMGHADPNLLPQHLRTGSAGSSQSSIHPNDSSSPFVQSFISPIQPATYPMSSGNVGSSQPMTPALQIASSTPQTPSQSQLYSEEQHRQKQKLLMKQKYHQMTETERQEFNRKHRLSSYGTNPKTTQLSFNDELQIVEAKARQAAAAKQKYHGMTPEEKKAFNEKRKQQRIQRKLEEDAVFSVPLEEATPEQQEKAQEIIEKKARIAENLHARYEAKTKPGRKLKSWHNLLKNVIAYPEKLEKLTEEERRSRKRLRDSKRYYEKKEQEKREKERMMEQVEETEDSPDSDSSIEIIDDEPAAGNSEQPPSTHDAAQNYREFLNNLNKKEADAARKAKRNEAAKLRYHRRMAKKKEELNKEQEASTQKATSSEPAEVAEDEEMSQDSPSSTNSAFDELFDAFDRDERQKQRNAAAARERYHKLPEPVRKELKTKIYESQKERHRNMSSKDKKVFNQKRSEAEKRRRLQETELLRSEFAEITPGEIVKAQGIVNKMDERNEKERLRYSQMTYDQKLKRTERRKELRKIQREKEKQKKEEEEFDASILDLGLEPDDSNDTEPSYEDRFLNSILNNS